MKRSNYKVTIYGLAGVSRINYYRDTPKDARDLAIQLKQQTDGNRTIIIYRWDTKGWSERQRHNRTR